MLSASNSIECAIQVVESKGCLLVWTKAWECGNWNGKDEERSINPEEGYYPFIDLLLFTSWHLRSNDRQSNLDLEPTLHQAEDSISNESSVMKPLYEMFKTFASLIGGKSLQQVLADMQFCSFSLQMLALPYVRCCDACFICMFSGYKKYLWSSCC